MHILRKILKWLGFVIGSLILFVALYLGFAYVLSRIEVSAEETINPEVTLYILTNGVHTDIVMPVRSEQMDWSMYMPFANTRGNDYLARWIALGWGDKGFYLETPTWADLKFSVAINAAFGLSSSAVHATYYRQMKEGDDCKKLEITAEQYDRLITFIKASLQYQSDLPIPIVTNANYGSSDAFYEAVGSYSMFHTCNTWTNNALKACGQKACLWTPFDTGIFYHYK